MSKASLRFLTFAMSLLCLVAASSASVNAASGILVPFPTINVDLSALVRLLPIVARVHIVKQTPVFIDTPVLDGNGSNEACGFVYDAEVVQAFKGGDKPFRFYSGTRQEFQEYFVGSTEIILCSLPGAPKDCRKISFRN